ncbi:MAG: HD domain-containing protein, partial [Erysipelotrichales bacterium]|nr:HD domain-containing protein [Erysipelotrichales bacterium]
LLYAGIILHDVGKVYELSGPVTTEYTMQGKLLGHISIMQAIVYETARKLGYENEQVILLRHMILSHHGQYEFGSPVLPMIPEAEILNYIDNIDARMNMFTKIVEPLENGTFSGRNFSLENRQIYKASFDKEDQ